MNYPSIKKYLGENWLKKQFEEIDKKDWVKEGIPKDKVSNDIAFSVLEKIDEVIVKFENIKNFSKWIEEAKTSKNFEDCLFELMALENLLLKSDLVELKPDNSVSGFVLEALVKKGEVNFFLEMTKLKSMEGSTQNKVEKLFGKARNKFRGLQGVHFIGVFNFFEFEDDIMKPLPKFNLLKRMINSRFERGSNSSILAFVLVNIYVAYNPKLNKTFVQKRFDIVNKPENRGGLPLSFFESIFDVNEFIEE
ncbi:hypothetical protein J4429_01220 [Candidatus Pacearchaeota archaeon]|nr:hypothetical protein [Candidatus Pacearchaeota archaeon]